MVLNSYLYKVLLITTTLILAAVWSTAVAQPSMRQNPLDPISHCAPGEYAQIAGDGLVCILTTNTAPPICSPKINCCGPSEFVKITGQGLQCFPLLDKKTTCTYPGETNCCQAYEFGFITDNGLICAAAPMWDVIDQFRVPEKTNFSLDLRNKVLGSPAPTITISTLPNWVTTQKEILGGKAPPVSRDQAFSFSVSAENIAGGAQTNISIIVQDRSCNNGGDCQRFTNHQYCHSSKQECVQCMENSQCPGSARCVDNACECGDCPITAPHCSSSTGHTCVECENDSHCPAEEVCSENTCTSCSTSSPKFTVETGEDTLTVQWEAEEEYIYQIQYNLSGSCDGPWQTPSDNLITFTNLTANTTYHICMRQKAPKCAGYSNPTTTTGTTGNCATSCGTGCSSWSPNVSANCNGSSFSQTRTCKNLCDNISCETTRRASGTASCDPPEEQVCTINSDCENGSICSCGVCTRICNNNDDCNLSELCADNDNRCSNQNANTQTASVCLPKPPTDSICSEKCDEGWRPSSIEVCQGVPFTQQFYTNCTNLSPRDNCGVSRPGVGTRVCRKIPGLCNNSVQSGCRQGVPNDNALADTEFLWRWGCSGMNGGISVSCQKNRPVNGRCNNNARNGCTRGILNDVYPQNLYYWRCDGVYGGSNSEKCSKIGLWKPSYSEWSECKYQAGYSTTQIVKPSGCECDNCAIETSVTTKSYCTNSQTRYVSFECQDGFCQSGKPAARIESRYCTCQ